MPLKYNHSKDKYFISNTHSEKFQIQKGKRISAKFLDAASLACPNFRPAINKSRRRDRSSHIKFKEINIFLARQA
jgi:hypothetical protein